MEGLSLPDVVRRLLAEPDVLRWDPIEGVYEVMDGDKFESRFNELRRVRNKEKTGAERPFSRMHNFFALASGEKWARAGTRFRPLNYKGFPESMPNAKGSRASKAEILNPAASDSYFSAQTKPSPSLSAVSDSSWSRDSPRNLKSYEYVETNHRVIPMQPASFSPSPTNHTTESASFDSVLGKRPARYFLDEWANGEDYIIPSHMIDSMASSLLHKRPRTVYPDVAACYEDHVTVSAPVVASLSKDKMAMVEDHAGCETTSSPSIPASDCSSHQLRVSRITRSKKSSISEEAPKRTTADPCDWSQLHAKLTEFASDNHGPKAAQADPYDAYEVYEVSSEGGSCQPSPEGPVLNLCDDSDLLPELDLGQPAFLGPPSSRNLHSHAMADGEHLVHGDDGHLTSCSLPLVTASCEVLDCCMSSEGLSSAVGSSLTCLECDHAATFLGSCRAAAASGGVVEDMLDYGLFGTPRAREDHDSIVWL